MKNNLIVVKLLIVAFVVLLDNVAGDEDSTLSYQDPSKCSLGHNETFSWLSLGCVKCQWASENAPDYCPCPPRMAVVVTPQVKCIQCPPQTGLYYGKHCLTCGPLNPYNASLGGCQPCPSGSVEVVYNEDGSPKEVVECVQCADGYHPIGGTCIPCHPSFASAKNGTCKCPELTHNNFGGVCFTNQELSSDPFSIKAASQLEFSSGVKVDSPLVRANIAAAFYLCKLRYNKSACHTLANLCTLNLHNYDGSEDRRPCGLYRSLVVSPSSSRVYTPYAPKLYYSEIEAPSVLIRPTTIPHVHNTQTESPFSDVNLTVAKFTLRGEFKGLSPIQELLPCKWPDRVLSAGRKFGSNFKIKCQVRPQDLWNEEGEDAMLFLDPYVSYEDGKGKREMIHIPVQILNFKRNGIEVNNLEDKYQWQFVRRFFMADTIGVIGTEDGDQGERRRVPQRIRYLESLQISIQLQNSPEPGKIYVPLLKLSYAELTREQFLQNEPIHFKYSVQYTMDYSRAIEDVKISIGVLSAVAVLWSAIQAWSWNRRNGQVEIDLGTILNLVVTSCGNLADIFFIVCICASLFWTVFFKKQVQVHVFLPDVYQERLVRDLLISAFALKIVAIIEVIRRQCNIDIFFVDWERPKVRGNAIPPASRHHHRQTETHKEASEESVSIWRTYFIANEWNELQTMRKIHMATQIVLTVFILEVWGFKYWGLHWADGSVNPDPDVSSHIPYSTTARCVSGAMVFGIIGALQWLLRTALFERYLKNAIQDFVDLCTLSNISVFILAAKQQGFYIHGRSVHGFADTDMQTMIEQLHREEEDLCSRRGLLPQTDNQTFLISVPHSFRLVYNQVLLPLYTGSPTSAIFTRAKSITSTPGGGVAKGPSASLSLSVQAYHSMNKFLTAFLEHALSDLDYDIARKSFFEGLLDMEFNEVGGDRAMFYTDEGHSFDSVLFYGHERTLFLFNLYTFLFVDIVSHNFLLAGTVLFFVDLLVKALRRFLGKRNLARKTLIDGRFLI